MVPEPLHVCTDSKALIQGFQSLVRGRPGQRPMDGVRWDVEQGHATISAYGRSLAQRPNADL
eukprot:794161-Alexandrium_andersonii.AAC.1